MERREGDRHLFRRDWLLYWFEWRVSPEGHLRKRCRSLRVRRVSLPGGETICSRFRGRLWYRAGSDFRHGGWATVYTTRESQREFASWSRRYDRDPLQWLFFQPTHRRILKQIQATDLRILDIGCGTGQFAAKVLRRFPRARLIGLDLCESMLEKAMCRSAGRFTTVRADSHKLPFADDSFDIVTCSHSFHHYPDQPRVVAEMYRVLRPGGRLFIADGNRDGLWGRLIFDGIVVAFEGAVKHLPLADFRELLSRSGFESIEQSQRGGLLPFAITVGTAAKGRVQMRQAG